jgi:hypothetical protein
VISTFLENFGAIVESVGEPHEREGIVRLASDAAEVLGDPFIGLCEQTQLAEGRELFPHAALQKDNQFIAPASGGQCLLALLLRLIGEPTQCARCKQSQNGDPTRHATRTPGRRRATALFIPRKSPRSPPAAAPRAAHQAPRPRAAVGQRPTDPQAQFHAGRAHRL